MAEMPWGAIFKLEFTDLKSRAEKQREIRPDYFIVTDNRIVLLNEEDNDAAAKKISALDKPPDVRTERRCYGITSGQLRTPGGRVENNNQIERRPLHLSRRVIPQDISKKSSGKRDVGLVEYASG